MKLTPAFTGATVGAFLAIGGLVAFDAATDGARAAADDPVTQSDLKAANDRSIRAIKQGTTVWNQVGKYLADDGDRISLQTPRVSQDAGTGDGGLPGSVIKDGAITTQKLGDGSVTEAKLAAALQARLPKWVTKVDNGANTTGRTSSPEYSVVRFGVGNYRADFGDTNVRVCSWMAVASTDGGLPNGFEVRTAGDIADATRVVVRTYDSTGTLVESGWQVQVVC